MSQTLNQQIAQHAKLAEVAYTDFSGVTLKNTESLGSKELEAYHKELIAPMIHNNNGKLPQTFATSIVEQWDIIAHWQDRGNIINSESGFSATLFQDKTTKEYVLAFRGSNGLTDDGGNDLIVTDLGDIVANGFALSQSIDLINFRQQLLGNKGEAYQVLTLKKDEIYEISHQLNSGTLRPQSPEEIEAVKEMAEKLRKALDSGEYIKEGADVYKMEWVDSTEIFHDERATGLGLSWDKISITGHIV